MELKFVLTADHLPTLADAQLILNARPNKVFNAYTPPN